MILPPIPRDHWLGDDKSYKEYAEAFNKKLDEQWQTLELCALVLVVGVSGCVLAVLATTFYMLFGGF